MSRLSFVVPSINGEERLLFICRWLASCGFEGEYVIVDGSKENKCDLWLDFPFAKYLHKPGTDTIQALTTGVQDANGEFVAILGDDDVPLLKGYKKCIEELDAKPNYGSARGFASFLNFDKILKGGFVNLLGCFSNILLSPRYDLATNLGSEKIDERLKAIFLNYVVTQFFVVRADVLKALYNSVIAGIGDTHTSEYAICFAQTAITRSLSVNEHYLLRGLGEHRPNSKPDNPRHRLDYSNNLEKKLSIFVKSLRLSDDHRFMIYRAVLVFRYRAAFLAGIGRPKPITRLKYLEYQIKRALFVFASSKIARIRFLTWVMLSRGEFLTGTITSR